VLAFLHLGVDALDREPLFGEIDVNLARIGRGIILRIKLHPIVLDIA
jgi:hypothetical protein